MISKRIEQYLGKSSFIRAMFEEGEKLRRIYGKDKVYDFSLGNPEIDPPGEVVRAFNEIARSTEPGRHRYMSNAGYLETRRAIAGMVNKQKGSSLGPENIVMTCGAAGAMNVVFKSILDPEDEVIVFSPYFVEYLFYIANHGGKPVIVPVDNNTFQPDISILEKNITKKTRAIIINSPNNPTGAVYSRQTFADISKLIRQKEEEFNTEIFVVSDEPYDRIVYDGTEVPSVFEFFRNSIIVNSFSKSLALPGERIGYIAVNTQCSDAERLMDALVFCNRTLGFVNAPAFLQKIVARLTEVTVDVNFYTKRRDLLYNHLVSLGFTCFKPQGAFYLFPETLIDDDMEFVRRAQKYNLLIVPGTGFGCPGYARLSFCIDIKTIENSLPAFEKLASEFRQK